MTRADVPLVASWLSDPRVLEFYMGRDDPQDEASIAEWLDEDLTLCIVEWEGAPIGYLQYGALTPEERAGLGLPDDEPVWGMDQFIGEPELWGRGIGSRLVAMVATELVRQGPPRVVMDPQAWNTRAIRAYEKAGFRKVKLLPEHERHEGEMRACWLMSFEGDDPERNPSR